MRYILIALLALAACESPAGPQVTTDAPIIERPTGPTAEHRAPVPETWETPICEIGDEPDAVFQPSEDLVAICVVPVLRQPRGPVSGGEPPNRKGVK